jgi:NAD(P)-dependent dehydrogenase (short-subunit alcohol dehydrogenase family)
MRGMGTTRTQRIRALARLRERVAGRVVVVTGASRGIGEATARLMADAGAHVVLLARDADALATVADEIRRTGGVAHEVVLDLRDTDAAARAAARVVADIGVPTVVVSNAGLSIRRYLPEYTHRFHDVVRSTGTNFLGPVALCMGLLPAMAAGGGHLVSISTIGVDLPAAGWSVYGATKSAFEAWLRAVAPELRAQGIATTSIHLPLVHTAMSHATPLYRYLPGYSAAAAARIIGASIVRRPRLVSPAYARIGGMLSLAFPELSDRLQAPFAARRLGRARRRRLDDG